MAQNNVSVGIRLTVDGKGVQGPLSDAAKQTKELGAAAEAAGNQTKKLDEKSSSLTGTLKKYKEEVLALASAYGLYKVYDYAKDATLLAARYETLGIVMRISGNNAGYSGSQMDEYAKKLERTGISMVKSREVLTSMAAAQIDLNKSQELGRMAQDLAVVANQNSSETLKNLITNIQQADTEGLRYMGITLSQAEALQKYATAHNTTTSALTQRQRSEAVLNAVMQEGAKYAGIYEQAMTTAGKALNSLDRYFENLKVKVGTPFLDGFAKGVFGVTDGVKKLNVLLDDLEKNGALEKLAQGFGSLVGKAVGAVTTIVTGVSGAVGTLTSIVSEFKEYVFAAVAATAAYIIATMLPAMATVGAAAWASMTRPILSAFAAIVAAARATALAMSIAFTTGGLANVGAVLAGTLSAALAAVPALVFAAAVGAGVLIGNALADSLGRAILNKMPGVQSSLESLFSWIDKKTGGMLSGVDPEAVAAQQKKNAEAEAAWKAGEADRLAKAKERQDKEIALRAAMIAKDAADVQIAVVEAANTRMKALNDARDAQLQRSLEQRTITQADYLQKKARMDADEIAGEMRKVAAERNALSAAMAASKAGAPGERNGVEDQKKMLQLNAQEAALQVQLNASKEAYAYRIASALIESYTKEFGTIDQLVESKRQLSISSKQELAEAGKTSEQIQVLQSERLSSAAAALEASNTIRKASGKATEEELKNTQLQINAMREMAAERLAASGSGFAAYLIGYNKDLKDDTLATYAEMSASFRFNEEERIRSAAESARRIMEIRKDEQVQKLDQGVLDAMAEGDLSRARQLADSKKQVEQAYADYVVQLTANVESQVERASVGFQTLADVMGEVFDPNRPIQFGQSMAASLGSAGQALTGMMSAFQNFDLQQRASEQARLAANKLYKDDKEKLAAAQSAITAKQRRDEVAYYANVADAAKGFFKEGSAGYKAMQAVSIAFHAIDTALALEAMAKKIMASTAVTTAEVAGAETKVVAQGAATAASVAMAGTEASAWGITAVVKAIASLPFPLNLAAGAATLAAIVGLGVKMMGGVGSGSMSVTQQRQEAQGTGSVLGDSHAKSNSIARSMELAAENSSTQINYLSGMLNSLRAIENNIGSFASLLVRTTGVTGSTAEGSASFQGLKSIPLVGGVLSKVFSSIFGGSTSVTDTGFTMARASLGSVVANGANASQFTDMHKDGGWFSSDKNWTDLKSLGADANAQFTRIIASLSQSIIEAGKLVGVSGDGFAEKLNGFVVDLGKVSLKGLTGDQIQKQLEAVFSKLGDDMAKYAIAGLDQFQKVGEGYLETLTRIAADYAKLDASLQSIGMAFGATGMQSIAAREKLISLMGGIDKFQSTASSFSQNFLSEAERLAPVQKYVNDQLAALGLTGIDTRDKFKALVLGLDLTKEKDQELYASLMGLSDAFAATHEAAKNAAKTTTEIADERADLQSQWDELTLSSVELLNKQRNALDASNRAMFDQIQAEKARLSAIEKSKSALKTAYDKEVNALKNTESQMQTFVKTLGDLMASSMLGDLSPLTPAQKYAEARSQFEQVSAAAKAGDKDAQSKYQSAFNSFLNASKTMFAGGDQYKADFAYAQQAAKEAQKWASQQVDIAQESLTALKDQVSGLLTVNDSVLDVKAEIQKLATLMGGSSGANVLSSIQQLYHTLLDRDADSEGIAYWMAQVRKGTTIQEIETAIRSSSEFQNRQYVTSASLPSYVSSGGSDTAMASLTVKVAELQAAISETTSAVEDLRKDQNAQTTATVTATITAAKSAAESIGESVSEAMRENLQLQNSRVAVQ